MSWVGVRLGRRLLGQMTISEKSRLDRMPSETMSRPMQTIMTRNSLDSERRVSMRERNSATSLLLLFMSVSVCRKMGAGGVEVVEKL